MRQRMQETLYQTGDAEVFRPDIVCRIIFSIQRMQESLYQTSD